MLRWLGLSLLVIGLDQVSKQLAESSMMVFERVPVIPFLNMTLA